MKETKKLKFPCCVPTSQIKDEATLNKLIDLFTANGADKHEKMWATCEEWHHYGVDTANKTVFWDSVSSYSEDSKESDVTIYSVEELLAPVAEEVPVVRVKVEPALLPVGTEVKIAESSEWYKDDDWSNPKDTKGIVIESDGEGFDDFCYRVKWDDNTYNSYKLNDLVLWEEAVVESPTEDNPWIEWKGDANPPVPRGTPVDVRHRNGGEWFNVLTGRDYATSWTGQGSYGIVAYRLHKPSITSQEATTDVLEDKPSISDSGYKEPTEPLVSITKDVKYYVSIKNTLFTFTQDQINELVSELEGYQDYE